jgi:glycosyltransferase involved in cell wall biosynthesis
MKKILFWGDSPTHATGFSNVIHNIITNLPKDEYDPYVLGINYNGEEHYFPYKIYTVEKRPDNPVGVLSFMSVIKETDFDIIFIISDVWVIDKMVPFIKQSGTKAKLVAYIPVDAEDHNPEWYSGLDIFSKVVMYNKFGLDVAKDAAPDLPYEVIPHGIDPRFHKLSSKLEVRKHLFPSRPELWDAFIFLNANRNQPRKRLDITLRAFKKFARDKKNIYLYLHCGVKDIHVDLVRISKKLGIDDKIIFTSEGEGIQNIPTEELNLIYNACDVGLNTGVGEGFGLCNVEHALTGAPQVLPKHSALADIHKDTAVFIPADIDFTLEFISVTAKLVLVDDVVNAMSRIYRDKTLYRKLSEKSIKKFSSPEYDWKEIGKQWSNLFNNL